MTPDIRPIDATAPQAIAAMQAYFAELDRIFPNGFDPGPLTADTLADMRPPSGAFLLATDGATTLGCVGLRREDATTAEVKRLWVAPSARGTGLAQRLMHAIENHARAQGATRLVLDTSRHLPGAVAFYRKHGWTEIPRYNPNPFAHHWFEKRLAPRSIQPT